MVERAGAGAAAGRRPLGQGKTSAMPIITAPSDLYRDPAVFARERETIFARTWQFFGLEADLVRAGDYLAETIAGYPLVVIRDADGALKGYHNVCRHRAGPLVDKAKGRCDRAFVCQFHDWRYGFDGRLDAATGYGPDEAFDAAQYSLFPIRVETWRNLVFVNLDLAAAPLIELLRPLDQRFAERSHRSARVRDRHLVACNWKVYVENYLDGFHLAGSASSAAAAAAPHRHEVQITGEVALHEGVDPAHSPDNFWAWIWPNLGISVYRGVLLLEQMRPEGPDRLMVDHIFLHAPEDSGVDAAILASERLAEEQAGICERVQQNLDAGVFTHGVLSPTHEGAIAWFQNRVLQAIGD
jgi:choline monooxygenase